jgi:hypothetical protein
MNTNFMEQKLTQEQKDLIVAVLLTDGWIEIQSKGVNPRIGLQQSDNNRTLIDEWIKVMKPFMGEKCLSKVMKTPPGSKTAHVQWQVRTKVNPEFHYFFEIFGLKEGKKTVPAYSKLMQHLNFKMFAWMLMMDGSKKKEGGRAMELHLQGFSKKAQDRLCIALYDKLGIKAWPSKYGTSKSGVQQYHIQISGFSLPDIKKNCEPFFLPSFLYKIPDLSDKSVTSTSQSPWEEFYNAHKYVPWLEDLSLDLES